MKETEKLILIKKLIENPVYKEETEIFEALRNRKNVIYGAGSFGKEMIELLRKNNIQVEYCLDRNAENIKTINGIKVYSLDECIADKTNTNVIFSIVCDKDVRKGIINEIKRHGFTDVIEAQSIRCQYVRFTENYDRSDAYEKIRMISEKFEDEKSRQLYLDNIIAHLSRTYSNENTFEEKMSEQYFPEDISPVKGYSCFVDCGGFIGDTVNELMKRYTPDFVVSFEPFIDNYNKLSDTCHSYENSQTKFILFNNAISDDVYQTRFLSGTGSGSVSENGDIIINAVSLDKVISGLSPTFIKMDIEGEEIKALCGCRKIIEQNTPDLAVCVYHNIDHLWEIPYLIYQMNNNYCFYLRSYNSYTMETVLYAYEKGVK